MVIKLPVVMVMQRGFFQVLEVFCLCSLYNVSNTEFLRIRVLIVNSID